jgi:thioredoxin 1
MIAGRSIFRLMTISRSFATGKNIHEVTSTEDFKQKISSIKTPILVDFYANWCGPCKALLPRLIKKAEEDGGKWTLLKVDIDNEETKNICKQFKVSAVPTLVLMKDGKEVEKKTGSLNEQGLS